MKKMNTGVKRIIFYSRINSPFGAIYIAFTEKGVSMIGLGSCSEDVFLENLKKNYHRKVLKNDKGLTVLRKEMKAYLKGHSDRDRRRKSSFSFRSPIDLLDGTPFEREVWDKIKKIPFGRVMTYGEIASRIGNPKASRAVGNACKNNPLPILIPCHRVVGKDLRLTGYSSGIEIKKRLLEMEGVRNIK